jgi:hypothetical protein
MDLKQKIKKAGMNLLKNIPDIFPSLARQFLGEGAGQITEQAIKALKEEFIPKLELLAEVDKETIYYDGIDKISNELSRIRARSDSKSFRIVVFVDDLDRCSPKRALEVFESVKVFLDIEGFIFVIGLSLTTIAKLIEKEYKDADVQGRDYIRKIIQIPIFLPEWNADDTIKIIDNLIKRNQLHGTYAGLIDENKDFLKTVIEPNPREIKRFINNFMMSYELFSSSNLGKEELLLVQALQFRWDAFYQKFMSDEMFRSTIIDLLYYHVELYSVKDILEKGFSKDAIQKQARFFLQNRSSELTKDLDPIRKAGISSIRLARLKKEESLMQSRRGDAENDTARAVDVILSRYKAEVLNIEPQLWELLLQNRVTISSISNWDAYRRATAVTATERKLQEVS